MILFRVLKLIKKENYIYEIKEILSVARKTTYSAINFIMVRAYWIAGRKIVLEEQNEKAGYGKQIIKTLARELSVEFDKNFTERRVREIRQFYLSFPFKNLWHSVSAEFKTEVEFLLFTKLSWTQLRENEQIFASKYKLYLPTDEELKNEIEREKMNFRLQFSSKK